MADMCGKIQELLSAYLDGRLSPEETARVAGHLELCPECKALLEKMRKLDNIAASAVDDFDDDLLNKLEQRIRADIEALPTVNVEQKPKVRRVTPVWYRYVAAAASIVLVFMIGRAFYKSGSLDEWLPFKQEKTVKTSRPPVQGAQPPASIRIKPASETPPEPAETKAIDQSAVVHPESAKPTQDISRKVSIPEPVPEVKTDAAAVEHESRDEMVSPPEDVRIATQAELKDLSRDKEVIRSDYQEMGKVIVAPAQTESQTKGKEAGVAAEEVIQKRSSVQTGRSDSTASTRKRLYVPPGVNTESDLGKSIVVRGETRREDTSSASAQSAPSELEKKAGQLKAQAVEELGKLGYNNAIASAPTQSAQTTTTLQSRYVAALAEYKPPQGLTSGFAGKRQGVDSTAAVRFVFGRAINMPSSNDLDSQAVKLYLMARAGYDLYRLTSDAAYLSRAVSAREALAGFLNRFADDPQKAKTAEAYRNELQRFTIQE